MWYQGHPSHRAPHVRRHNTGCGHLVDGHIGATPAVGGLNSEASLGLESALRTLVLSDIHYPTGISGVCFDVIRREAPDTVVLLGDIVVGHGQRTLANLTQFLKHYPHPLENTAIILGDNEFRGNRATVTFVEGLVKLNSDPFSYRFGNMFFTHGNVEGRGPLSAVLEELGGCIIRLTKPVAPTVVSAVARLRNSLDPQMYAFLGHIHFLGYVARLRTVFCGTFSTRTIVYGQEESLGYVVLDHNDSGHLEPSGIHIVSLTHK